MFLIASSECFLVIADWFYKLLFSKNGDEEKLGFEPVQAFAKIKTSLSFALKIARKDDLCTEKYIQVN